MSARVSITWYMHLLHWGNNPSGALNYCKEKNRQDFSTFWDFPLQNGCW